MEIERLIVGPLRTNCYLLNDGGDCMIIDPGGDHDVIIEHIERKGIVPKMIVATHAHFDHILSVSALKSKFDVPFLLNRKDEAILETFIQYSETYTGIHPGTPPIPDRHFRNEDSLKFGNKSLRVVETPGHTPGSSSFIVDNSMFSGDFIFEGSIGRTDFGGSYTEMSRSIQWAKSLEINLDIYPGHGEFTTLEEEKKSNPFFKKIS
jgi:glyoxylase-like metal-dependent hydrolase (beta-lactamase superfamily II)